MDERVTQCSSRFLFVPDHSAPAMRKEVEVTAASLLLLPRSTQNVLKTLTIFRLHQEAEEKEEEEEEERQAKEDREPDQRKRKLSTGSWQR